MKGSHACCSGGAPREMAGLLLASALWVAGCDVGGDSAAQQLEAARRTATAQELFTATAATAASPTVTPTTPKRTPTRLVTGIVSPTATVPPLELSAARVGAIAARMLTTVAAQPIQLVGFLAGIDRARARSEQAGGAPAGGLAECAVPSCGSDGTVIERVLVGCPSGGSICTVCAETSTASVVTQEHDGCSVPGAMTTGGLRLTIGTRGACTSSEPLPEHAGVHFCDFVGSDRQGSVRKDYDAAVTARGSRDGCPFAQLSATLDGRIAVLGFRDHVNQEFVLHATTIDVDVTRFLSSQTCTPLDYLLQISGPVVLADRNTEAQSEVRFERAMISWKRVGSQVELHLDGVLTLDCIGAVSVRTVTALVAAADATCPDAGELELEIGGTTISVYFMPDSRVVAGLPDTAHRSEFGSCVDDLLSSACSK